MGRSNDYQEKYKKAKSLYQQGEYSITQIAKILQMDRGTLSSNLKKDGIEVINKQNLIRVDEAVFDVIDTEEKAYWLGFLYADGYVEENGNAIELTLKLSDKEHLEKFKKFLKWSGEVRTDDYRARVCFKSKKVKNDLIALGCHPNKSLTLTFPTENQVPLELIRHFIRGYVDGDGSVFISNSLPRFSILGTHDMLDKIVKNMKWKSNQIRKTKNIYSIEWGGNVALQQMHDIYKDSNIYLDRKYTKYKELYDCRGV